jgi:hypothetical protein
MRFESDSKINRYNTSGKPNAPRLVCPTNLAAQLTRESGIAGHGQQEFPKVLNFAPDAPSVGKRNSSPPLPVGILFREGKDLPRDARLARGNGRIRKISPNRGRVLLIEGAADRAASDSETTNVPGVVSSAYAAGGGQYQGNSHKMDSCI